MKIYNVKQGSTEWKTLRLGMITGSRLKDVCKADNLPLVDELIAERISDEIEEGFTNASMQWGIDHEPEARKEYENATGTKVTEIGFCISNEYDYLGVSPDGLVETNGKYEVGVEIKCPNTATHVRYIRMNKIPNEYKYQVYCYFLVCQDLKELDFVSYDPRFLVKPLHIITINRFEIEEELEKMKQELEKFWIKFKKYYNQIVF